MAVVKKYELTKIITKLPCGIILHRIRALRNIREGVKKGDLGGWVQTEWNLGHNNTSWIYGEAKCYHHGKVIKKAILYDSAVVRDQAFITDEAKVGGTTIISGVTEIGENTWLYGSHEYNCQGHQRVDHQGGEEQGGLDELPIHLPNDTMGGG